MLSSSEMDSFLAGLSEDCFECYPKNVLVTYIHTQTDDCGESLEEIHTKLEGFFVKVRESKGLPYVDPKPFSGEVKKKRMVVYNRWTEDDLKKFASSKTASAQSKSEESSTAIPYSAQASGKTSYGGSWQAMHGFLYGSTATN